MHYSHHKGSTQSRGSCLRVGLALIVLICFGCQMAGEGTTVNEDADKNEQPPLAVVAGLLGHSIEGDLQKNVYRLVRHGEQQEVIASGTLEECEKALLVSLKEKYGTGKLNLPFFTLGGKQFWADVFVYGGWRIQQNVYTEHYRLLDPDDIRRAWGTYEACRVAFEELRREEKVSLKSRHLVILVHGIIRSKDSMRRLIGALEVAGYAPESVNYPSTRRSLDEHAEQLERIIDAAPDVDSVSFVTHSMGALVVRATLARESEWRKRIKLHRVVMLAPPNKGATLADLLKDFVPYQLLAGPSGQSLTRQGAAKLPVPPCSFGIIAGGRGSQDGFNFLIPGDDDLVVGVNEAKLAGADDFVVVRVAHSFIMNEPEVIRATVSFLKTGKFSITDKDE